MSENPSLATYPVGHDHDHDQPIHEEVSIYPAIITVGILFLLPFAFMLKFVYLQALYAAASLGIGVPLVLWGIIGWVSETVTAHKTPEQLAEPDLAFPAMGWFILAEAMIFVSFFVAYWYTRLTADVWPPLGSVELPKVVPLVMTGLLVASSFTIHAGEIRLEKGDRSGFVRWLMITMLLGLSFLALSGYEWNHLLHSGFNPGSNVFASAFFSITGFHGSHVLVGLGIFTAMLVPAMKGKVSHALVKSGSLYWHFVDIIWFFVVSQVYFW